MRKFMIAAIMVFVTVFSANAQYGGVYDNYSNGYDDDRYYYDDEFDWHWDIRVRISNGIQNGLITRNEANRLYRRLEDVERKEYIYLSDGIYMGWEQREIWDDVAYLNRQVGLELYDYDRRFYGFDLAWNDLRGYPRWYYQGGFDFYRFDRRGFGNIRFGYTPRTNYRGWYHNDRNRIAREYYNERSRYRSNPRTYDNGRYESRRYDNNNSRGGYDNSRGSRPDWNNNERGRGNDNNRSSRPSWNNNERGSRGEIENTTSTPIERSPRDYGNETRNNRPNAGESRSDNYGRGSGVEHSRSERDVPNTSEGNRGRGERNSEGGRSERSERPSNEGGGRGEGRGRRN
ncbi:hypothetical protein Emtol_2105 [Emticicia oligotrophica DSM 17448]|uniref:Uncharacterized protein n=1 Tax=Emticicia oligotrophica (strain DSM 17448 / CIP 109782 / MTCC 6937 / GPTSA100-15) TaxID=929562 RepID=A0ABN4AMB4_EMTOG|nr:hypothetical protein [Emticicia oligotrophica]AFK03243.1 hypothetical protein Emtol_2105 [Emticicia oligotrophica DSM 17448]